MKTQTNPYEDEKQYLATDRARYMECMNGKPLSARTTEQEIHDGLILHFHVYHTIIKNENHPKQNLPKV